VQALPGTRISDLRDFKQVKKKIIFFSKRKNFVVEESKLQSYRGCGRVLLGDNAGGRVVMLQPIRSPCVGVRIAARHT
jgi:hypothetical protein